MSVICSLHTKTDLVRQEIEATLKEIIHRRFHDLFSIQANTASNEICDWELVFDSVHKFPVVLKNNHELIFEHPDILFNIWVQLVVEDELALKYSAQIIDEEYPQQILKPDLEHHITFRNYLEHIFCKHSKTWQKAIIETEIAHLPDELKKL